MRSHIALGLLIPLALACGGVSVEPSTHLTPFCDAESPHVERVQLDRPAKALEPALPVFLTATSTVLESPGAQSPPSLELALIQKRTAHKDRFGDDKLAGHLLAWATPNTPTSRIKELVTAAAAAGFHTIDFVVDSHTEFSLPNYPDPATADALKAQLSAATDAEKPAIVALAIEEASALCPGVSTTFEAIVHAAPEYRCELVAQGMNEVLPTCLATDGDALLTMIQVMMEPSSPFKPTFIRVKPDPRARPIIVNETMPWSELVERVAKRDNQGLWLL